MIVNVIIVVVIVIVVRQVNGIENVIIRDHVKGIEIVVVGKENVIVIMIVIVVLGIVGTEIETVSLPDNKEN